MLAYHPAYREIFFGGSTGRSEALGLSKTIDSKKIADT
jgi:hypothetical protein